MAGRGVAARRWGRAGPKFMAGWLLGGPAGRLAGWTRAQPGRTAEMPTGVERGEERSERSQAAAAGRRCGGLAVWRGVATTPAGGIRLSHELARQPGQPHHWKN